MQWRGRRESDNVEVRQGRGGKIIGGGVGLVVTIIAYLLFGGDPGAVLNQIAAFVQSSDEVDPIKDDERAQFISVVLADTEDVWTAVFAERGLVYEKPKLVLYSGSVDSACGTQQSYVGPFYCPGDRSVYIDLSFYDDLKYQLNAPGDFAMAYVVAHEVGHHVQTLLGSGEDEWEDVDTEKEANAFSVKYELQADYLAGVWANHVQGMNLLEAGDVEEALTAASAVGDDKLQEKVRGYSVPETFTHGTAEQRKRWLSKGLQTGTIEGGDTFGAKKL
ncbi:neutral zinc metallopeptidase [Cohnella soli]|uniref:Neutral zinc metallopeptidase n=1 Tax=Cohnella soli TaxID=425005 RepID=A0ABW0HLJ2_9BACL